MSKHPVWFGYLDAGNKSTLVAVDHRLNTGDPLTLYLYNHARGRILEYKREIVEPKLRDLTSDETGATRELKSAFEAARRDFQPRAARVLNLAETGSAEAPARSSREDAEEEPVLETVDVDDEELDEDWEEEEAS
jgi:hypothetical protein